MARSRAGMVLLAALAHFTMVGSLPIPALTSGPTCAWIAPSLVSKRGGGGYNGTWVSLIYNGVRSLLNRVLAPLLPKVSFVESFERGFGTQHPPFLDAPTLGQAATAARATCKFLLVYLPSSSPREEKRHQAFCKTLTNPEVIKAVGANFVMWVPSADSAALRGAAKELNAKRLPFLGVAHLGQKAHKVALRSVHHFKPPPTPDQALTWLSRTLEIHGHLLEQDKKDMDHQAKEAKLLKEQGANLNKALKADKDRIEKEKRDAKEKAKREAAEKKKAAEDAARRGKKKHALGAEPEGTEVCRIMVKLPGGKKIQRAFKPSDSVEMVLDWTDVEGLELDKFKLVRNRPRATFTYPESNESTLEAAGIHSGQQVLLFVEPRGE